MQDTQSNWKQISLGIIFLALLSYGAFEILNFFIDAMKTVDEKISAAIIAGMFTVFAGLAAVLITQTKIRDREVEEAYREKKIKIYSSFIQTAVSFVADGNEDLDHVKVPTTKELVHFMFQYKQDILLWGSPKVIKAHLRFEEISRKSPEQVVFAVNDVYSAMREDIGLSNSNLNNFELIKLFLSDPDEVDQLASSNKRKK